MPGIGGKVILALMLRMLHVALTIFALLACPMRCSGGFSALSSIPEGHVQPVRRCACCQRRAKQNLAKQDFANRAQADQAADRSSGGLPVPRDDDDCGCANCLCRGAVLSQKVAFHPTIASEAFIAVPVTGPLAAGIPACAAAGRGGPPHPDAFPAGRQLRFALQSLLN